MATLDPAQPLDTRPRAWPSPRTAEVEAALAELVRRDPVRVTVETVEVTDGGRPIRAVTLTDPRADPAMKQHVLIAAGQHGNEESARLVALALMRRLLDDEHAAVLQSQKIVVMPNVNPDGAEDDTYATAMGVKPNLDHGAGGPTTPEGRALERVAEALMPDVYVDMHARGHAGCSYDMVLYPETESYTEDDNLFHEIARDMVEAGEAAGLPHVTHPLTWWTPPPGDDASSTRWCYRNFKSIVMLTESAEDNDHAYPQRLTADVGVARVMALLQRGDARHPKLYHHGYPNDPILGMFSTALVSVGETAEARRLSRVGAWRERAGFRAITRTLPEACDYKHVRLEYAGPTLPHGVGVMIRVAGPRDIVQVRRGGRPLYPSPTDGYYHYGDGASTFVVVAFPELRSGAFEIEVDLEPSADAGD